jgi:hypothetical protein
MRLPSQNTKDFVCCSMCTHKKDGKSYQVRGSEGERNLASISGSGLGKVAGLSQEVAASSNGSTSEKRHLVNSRV